MKKILILVLIVLFGFMSYYLFTKTVVIGKLEVMGIFQIKENSDALTSKIQEVNNLIDVTYNGKLDSLQTKKKDLLTAKQNYFDLVENSSETEIQEATNEEKYTIEYLWTRIGNYATKQGVVVKLELSKSSVNTNAYKLNFTVDGPYVGILNFIYDIENDSELGFKIDSFGVVTGGEAGTVTATFTCENIGIDEASLNKQNASSTSTQSNSRTNSQGNSESNSQSDS